MLSNCMNIIIPKYKCSIPQDLLNAPLKILALLVYNYVDLNSATLIEQSTK